MTIKGWRQWRAKSAGSILYVVVDDGYPNMHCFVSFQTAPGAYKHFNRNSHLIIPWHSKGSTLKPSMCR
jgi:hypothetical protein